MDDDGAGEEPLTGGTMGGAVRVGETVRRPAGPWTPTVQRLLAHLHRRGVERVPEPLGLDEQGRDVLSHLPGVVPQHPLPPYVWSEDVLVAAARLVAQLHEAGADFDTSGAVWRLPTHEPAEVVCHNDVAPYNMVFQDGRLSGLIDWDTASPGPRAWDLAYLAYRLVPLTDPGNPDVPASTTAERARRLRVLCEAYGPLARVEDVAATAVHRLEDLAEFTAARHAQGQDELAGHAELYRRDARWIAEHQDELTSAVTLVRSPGLFARAEYADASTVPAGARLLFLAGACPIDADGATVAAGDHAAQAAVCVQNLRTALAAAGASLHDVVSTRVLVASTRREDLVRAWAVVRDAFGDHDVPSTLLGVTVLGYEDQLVELEATAAVLR